MKKAPLMDALRVPFEEQVFPFWKTLFRCFEPAKGLILLAVGLNLIFGLAITAQNALPKFLADSILLSEKSVGEKLRDAAPLMGAFMAVAIVGRILCRQLSIP